MLSLLITFIFIALISVGISIPLILRQVKPNVIYGFRVRKTLKNPEIWYAVNEHFGWRLLACSVIFLVAAILLYGVPGISLDAYMMGSLFAFVIPFAIGMTQTTAYLKKFPTHPAK